MSDEEIVAFGRKGTDYDKIMESEKKSRALADDLCEHLNVSRDNLICYTEMALGDGIMDVWALKSSWGDRDVRCYEVKVSRSDYWSDVNSGKYMKYLPYCRRFYFATPSKLVKKAEVPEGCGLITRNENGWRVVKPPTPHEPSGLTQEVLLWLVREIHYREAKSPERARRIRDLAEQGQRDRVYVHGLGREISTKLSAYESGQTAANEQDDWQMKKRQGEALELLVAVEDLAAEAGIDLRDMFGDDAVRRAEFAVAMIRHADTIREIGGLLSRLPYKTAEDIAAVVR